MVSNSKYVSIESLKAMLSPISSIDELLKEKKENKIERFYIDSQDFKELKNEFYKNSFSLENAETISEAFDRIKKMVTAKPTNGHTEYSEYYTFVVNNLISHIMNEYLGSIAEAILSSKNNSINSLADLITTMNKLIIDDENTDSYKSPFAPVEDLKEGSYSLNF